MSIKKGDVISHSGASEWGVGKVVEVAADKVTVHFNDGITRKIGCTHFGCLLPARSSSYSPAPEVVVKVVAAKPTPKARKTVKP